MTIADRPNARQVAELREEFNKALGRGLEETDLYRLQLQQRVRKYERRYEMSSQDMLKLLATRQLKETRDISVWLWTYDLLACLDR